MVLITSTVINTNQVLSLLDMNLLANPMTRGIEHMYSSPSIPNFLRNTRILYLDLLYVIIIDIVNPIPITILNIIIIDPVYVSYVWYQACYVFFDNWVISVNIIFIIAIKLTEYQIYVYVWEMRYPVVGHSSNLNSIPSILILVRLIPLSMKLNA